MGREARCTASWGSRSGEVTALLESTELIVRVLGAAARRWADALATPRPTLAARLGIAPYSRVIVEGRVDDEALAAALAEASAPSAGGNEMIVARVDDPDALTEVVTRHRALLARGVPIWVVYTKGRGAPLGESAVRTILRQRGLMDLKVASVSAALTALKFARLTAK